MTFGSLFAGVGGIDLGLERAGMKCLWQVEIDAFCQGVLSRHWPNVRRYPDIRSLETSALERPDIIAGGFPCQPVSLAGKRKGRDDDRWLWPEFARVIRDLRPRFVLVENSPGLLGAGFGEVLGDLASLGYDAEWSVLSACRVGAPHPRERLFIVAYPQGEWREQCGRVQLQAGGPEAGNLHHWQREPCPDRVADGVSRRMDRRRALGNAVVPQVAEWIGRAING